MENISIDKLLEDDSIKEIIIYDRFNLKELIILSNNNLFLNHNDLNVKIVKRKDGD